MSRDQRLIDVALRKQIAGLARGNERGIGTGGRFGDVVLRDRRALANDGMFMIVVQIDKQTNKMVGRPEIITRGFVHGNEDDPMFEEAIRRIREAVEAPGDRISEIALLKVQIKDSVSRFLYEQTKRRPMVFPVVVEV